MSLDKKQHKPTAKEKITTFKRSPEIFMGNVKRKEDLYGSETIFPSTVQTVKRSYFTP